MRDIRNYAACLALAGLAACSSLGIGGTQYSSRSATPPPPAPVASDTIRQVQSTLQKDGYYRQGNIDGVWGTGTENAVEAFQRDHSLTVTGQLDGPTLQAMNLASNPPNPPAAPYNPPPSSSTSAR